MWHETCVQSYNEQSARLSGAYMYMYTNLQTQWHIHCCYRWLISLSQTFLQSHCSNTIVISTVVMLGFWLSQFSAGCLACGLCLLSSTNFFFFLFEYNICSLC
jgi:hypothetical protein